MIKIISKILLIFNICILVIICKCGMGTVLANSIEEPDDVISDENFHKEKLRHAFSANSQYSSNINSYDNFLQMYFDNLTYNYGVNYKGSCGYVAIGMLLSYYDTFLNDDIIPEQYDINSIGQNNNMILRRNSPGVMRDYVADSESASNWLGGFDLDSFDYYNSISSLSNVSLHAKLICIGAELGYYKFYAAKNFAGTNFMKRLNVIEYYMDNVIDYADKYEIESINATLFPSLRENVRNFTIEKVQNGQPVLLAVCNDDYGHAVIAYDYDENENKLYGHMGWGPDETHVSIEDEFNVYQSALVINFQEEHSHTNNYGITSFLDGTITTEFYCCNDCQIITYNHSHFFDGHFCEYCNFANNSHNYGEPYIWIDYSVHSGVCECGLVGNQGHAVMGSGNGINGFKTCIRCGGLAQIGFDFNNPLTTGYIYESENGSYISSNGVIVLNELDVSLYYSGTLQFYKKLFISSHTIHYL